MSARSPGSPLPGLVNVLPSATHPTLGTQLNALRKLSAVTWGLGCTDHDEPFQYSTTLCSCGPFPPLLIDPVDPTAQHCAALTHEILASMPGDVESGTDADASVQDAPSQCSMRIPDIPPLPSVVAPDAQQSLAPTHSRPLR